jgi:hypothetical protein
MKEEFKHPSFRLIFRIRLLGILSALLGIGYLAVSLLGLTLVHIDVLILIAGSLILVFGFAIYRLLQIEKRIETEMKIGRSFLGTGVCLFVALLLGISAFLLVGINQFSDLLSVNRWEGLLLIPYLVFVFLSAGLSFYLGFRYHQLIEESFFVEGGLFLAVGIPSLMTIVLLIILSLFAWGPAVDILSLITIALGVFFFVIFIFSAIFNKEASNQNK